MATSIVLDARHIKSGIGTYTRKLLQHLPPLADEFTFRALILKGTCVLPQHPNLRYQRVSAGIYGALEQLIVPIRARGARLLHSLHYNVPLLFSGRSVVTIHDLTHLMFPEFLPNSAARLYAKTMISQAVVRSDGVVVLSQFMKNQLIDHLDVPEAKIHVIASGIDRPPLSPLQHQLPRPMGRPYLLYVGNLKPHKNLERLIQAFGLLRARKHVPHTLVLVGSGNQEQALQRLAESAGLGDAIFFAGFVEDRELACWYPGAEAFVMPSLSEGFGFPALEAMASNVPVVAARATALPEILGDAALFFEPTDVEDLCAKLWQLISDESLRCALRRRAPECLSRYSWQCCATQHADLYRNLLQN